MLCPGNGKVPAVSGGWARLRAGPGIRSVRAGSQLYPQGAVWGKHTLTALPADAISPGASISLRGGRAAVPPPRVAATTPAASPAAPQPTSQQAPRLGHFGLALRSAPAIPTAAGTMKVTAYDFDSYFTEKCVCGWSRRFLRDTEGRKGTGGGAPWSVLGSLLCGSRPDGTLHAFQASVGPPRTGCASPGVFTAAFVSGDERLPAAPSLPVTGFAEEEEAFLRV